AGRRDGPQAGAGLPRRGQHHAPRNREARRATPVRHRLAALLTGGGSGMRVYSGRFQHRVAAITGGASGVGREAAARIAAEGGRVFLWDRDERALAAAAAAIPGAQTARVDVSDAHDMARAAEAAFRAGGRL